MGYNRRNTTLILIITLVSVLGLSIAFAAFSSSLTVKGNATITPDSGNFKVVFSSSSTSLSTTNVSVTKTGNATAGTPTIDNSGNPTIKNLSASFTSPGEKVEYTFYARNGGSYDAYLSSVVFDNIKNKSTFKECVAGSGTTASMVDTACNGIKVTTTVLSTSYTSTTLNITNHVLKKNNSELVKVTIEYTSGSSVADGPFTINFGKIYLTYGSTSLSGMPTLPADPVAYLWYDGTDVTGPKIGEVYKNYQTKVPEDKKYYLKYVLDSDDTVTEAYACAIFNDKETCFRGGSSDYYGYSDNEENYTGNFLIIQNLKSEGISCYTMSSSSSFYICHDNGNPYVNLYADSAGKVQSYINLDYCQVFADGRTKCYTD